MRFLVVPTIILLLSAPGYSAAQQQPGNTQPAPPEAQQKPAPSNTPEQQRGVNDYLNSPSGRNGKQEPSASANETNESTSGPVLVNGALNVPGAPKDSQTVPAKYSAHNDAIDKTPILAMPIGLTDAQKRKILASLRATNAPVEKIDAKLSATLPSSVQMVELPAALKSEIPNLKDLKFVRLEDRALIIYAPNRLVVGEIKN